MSRPMSPLRGPFFHFLQGLPRAGAAPIRIQTASASCTNPAVKVQPSEPTILRNSVSVKAFRVCVVTLPAEPADRANRAQVSSSGNSETNTAS